MRCEDARRLESARHDGLGPATAVLAALDLHLAECRSCATYRRELSNMRVAMRAGSSSPPPLRIPSGFKVRRRRPAYGLAVAGVAAGLVAGLVFGGLEPTSEPTVVAGLTERLATVQTEVDAFTATVAVLERGWHPQVPERTYRGWVAYRGPDQAAVVLSDSSVYPSEAWVRNDVEAVVDRDAAWLVATQPCPASLQPGCSRAPAVAGLTARAPFEASALVASDLVAPVRSLVTEDAVAASPRSAPVESEVIGLRMSVAQARPLLGALLPGGNWREFHPADHVDVWLSQEQLVPVAVQVWAVDDPARMAWAATHGYADGDEALLEVILSPAASEPAWPSEPVALTPGSFLPGVGPGADLAGLAPWRSGRLEGVSVESWATGAAWIRLDRNGSTPSATLHHLIELETEAGFVYFDPARATLLALDGSGPTTIRGSVPLDVLVLALDQLGIDGRRLASPQPAVDAGGLILGRVDGFGPVSVMATADGAVSMSWGGGTRLLRLASRPGLALPPPVDPAVVGVEMRGIVARYSAEAGRLAWVEAGSVYSLEGVGMTLAQLVEVADGLVPHP